MVDFRKIENIDLNKKGQRRWWIVVSVVSDRDLEPMKVLPTFYTSACSSSLRPQGRRSRLRFQNREGEKERL